MSRMRSGLMAFGRSTRRPATVYGSRLSAADRDEGPSALTRKAAGRAVHSRPSPGCIAPAGWRPVQTMMPYRNRAFGRRPGCEGRSAGEGLLLLLSGKA